MTKWIFLFLFLGLSAVFETDTIQSPDVVHADPGTIAIIIASAALSVVAAALLRPKIPETNPVQDIGANSFTSEVILDIHVVQCR